MPEKKKQEGDEMVYIQSCLNAPKNQRNTFGNYNYRSCEDILEAVKPLLKETGCTLTVSDEIVQVSDRIYVKATATMKTPSGETYSTNAFAREPLSKKGMDDSQVTGTASSYARKYALNGLFCIDDNKDADALNVNKEFTESEKKPKTTAAPQQTTMFDDSLQEAFELIRANIENAPSRQYLTDLHAQNPELHNFPKYRELMNKKFKELAA